MLGVGASCFTLALWSLVFCVFFLICHMLVCVCVWLLYFLVILTYFVRYKFLVFTSNEQTVIFCRISADIDLGYILNKKVKEVSENHAT